MTRSLQKTWFPVVAALAMTLSACGDDEPAAKKSEPRKPAATKAAAKKKAGAETKTQTLEAYPKIPEEYRKTLRDIDFVADASGETNRDPFRSFILNTGLGEGEDTEIKAQDLCTGKNVSWQAQGYSIRDLELSAIIKRGRSNALFVDKSKKDIFILREGDCLGQEKAVIEEVGVKYVRLSMKPEAAPGAEPITKDIALHPKELESEPTETP